MLRQIIKINESKCNGCGLCVSACFEGAIGLVDGKARLLRDDYCDGLGNCLPVCPQEAISFEEREAAAFDEAAVKAAKHKGDQNPDTALRHWPVQMKLISPNASFLNNADLLVAADCTAYACGDFHNKYMKDRITVIGCPKLDGLDYAEKLTDILKTNEIKSVTVARMEVPCCSGLEIAAKTARQNSVKQIPLQVVTISTDGRIIES